MSIFPADPVAASGVMASGALASGAMEAVSLPPPVHSIARGSASFSDLLIDGIDATAGRIEQADRLVRDFLIDDSVPIHRVTFALEQARLSLELATQVRTRVLDGFQQLMNMQI
jgi:flagellar hook-basal body complex protein FliE